MAEQSKFDVSPRAKGFLMVALFLGLFLILCMNAMGNIVGALIAGDLQNMSLYAMIYTIFYLFSSCTMPFTAKLGEKYGRKPLIAIGILLYGGATTAAGFAPNMMFHLLMRGLQGMGQGFLQVNILAFFGEYLDAQGRAKAMGMYGTLTGIVWVICPVIGGLVGDLFGWRPIFYSALPIALIIFIILMIYMPAGRPAQKDVHIDWLGSISLIVAAVCAYLIFTYGGSTFAWASVQIIGLAVICIAAFIVFLKAIQHAKSPVISPELFRNRNYVYVILCVVLTGISMYCVGSYLSVYCVAIVGTSATVAGTVAAAKSAVQLVLSYGLGIYAGKSSRKLKTLMLTMPIMYVVSNLMFGFTPIHAPVWVGFLAAMLSGYCTTVYMMSFTLQGQNSVRPELIGEATSTIQFVQALGGTIGMAIINMVLNNTFNAKMANVIPAGLSDYVSDEQLTPFMNANILTNPTLADDLLSTLPSEGQTLFAQLVENIRNAYAGSLCMAFIVMSVLCVVALIFIAMMKVTTAKTDDAQN